ncbi:MAG: ribosome maturation factor RimP, partial [Gammaproteobacteria bacterium]|nr:ribosome maturation factor RimP [Gammaproteobacteria bacterium]
MGSEELARLLQPSIERLGYELSDLEARLSGGRGVVRVFIDKPGGIGLE